MSLLVEFKNYWKQNFPQLQPSNCHILVAVSGGLDSVVLTDLLHHAGFAFTIAHCNFQLRGPESDRDEVFVQQLGEKYGVKVLIKKFDTQTYADQNKIGIQETARKLRYSWFKEVIRQHSSSNSQLSTVDFKLATAHHADDNVETVLFNIFRGTGMNGLHGVLPQQNPIIRPLLFAKRDDIIAYAKNNDLAWVEDSSNASTKYTRNYIRHEVMPLLKQIFPSVVDNISGSIDHWREGEELYKEAIALHKKKLCVIKSQEVHIPVLKLQKSTPLKTITYEIIKDYGFTSSQTNDVLNLLESESGKYVASNSHRIIRNRNWLIITPIGSTHSINILIEEGDKQIVFADGKLDLASTSVIEPSVSAMIATIDAGVIKFPLLLRKWKQGDYFYPLGMQKKKKLSRFLSDQKVPLHEKEKVWVIESNKKIVWVIGHRIDDRFKITNKTKHVLKLSYQI